MTEILILTLALWAAVNLPLFWLLAVQDREMIPRLLGHAPNQFLYLIVFYPVGVIGTLLAWKDIIQFADLGSDVTSKFIQLKWPIPLIGAFLALVIAVIDYVVTVPDYDQLAPKYARRAIVADRTFWEHLGRFKEPRRRLKERISVIEAAAEKVQTGECLLDEPKTTDDSRTNAIESSRFLQVLSIPKEGQSASDRVSRVLNVVELAVVVWVAYHTIVGSGFLGIWGTRTQLNVAAGRLLVANIAFGIFVAFRAYNRFEVEFATGDSPRGLAGDWVVFATFFGCTVMLLVFYWPQLGPLQNALGILGGIITAGGTVVVTQRPENFRKLIGADAGWGNLIVIVIVVGVFAALALLGWSNQNSGQAR